MQSTGARQGTIRVLVADDYALVREGVVKLITADRDIQVVAEVRNGFDAVAKARELGPDIVLMDLFLPGLDGLGATRLIRREMPQIQVIILTASEEERDVLDAIQAGARGYILKNVDARVLVQQLKRVVMSDSVALSEDMTTRLVKGLSVGGNSGRALDSDLHRVLTEREKEVLTLIAKGKTNKEIATELIISEHTARAHVRSLMQKLNLNNRTQLAVRGIREGFGLTGRSQDGRRTAPALQGMPA